jgi:hypothetical protein
MSYREYDPTQLSIVLGGFPINGFAQGSMLSIEREHPFYKISHDAYGNLVRSKVNKDTTKIIVTLTNGSYGNNIVTKFFEMDRLNNNGIFPVMIKEPKGTMLFAREYAFVLDSPKIEYAAETQSAEWTLYCSQVTQS